jgi:repressor LexA
MARGKLSDRQRKMLDFIRMFSMQSGYPPSIREIGEAVDISSTSVVNYNLNRLVDQGYLDRDQNVSRGLRLTEKLSSAPTNTVRVPLVGRIFASEPVPIPDTDSPMFGADEAIEITQDLLSTTEDLFALEVKGDSMIDAMINEGDIVVMQRKPEWSNGDTVRLQPANPTMKPIYVENPENLEVQGKVMLVLRQLH